MEVMVQKCSVPVLSETDATITGIPKNTRKVTKSNSVSQPSSKIRFIPIHPIHSNPSNSFQSIQFIPIHPIHPKPFSSLGATNLQRWKLFWLTGYIFWFIIWLTFQERGNTRIMPILSVNRTFPVIFRCPFAVRWKDVLCRHSNCFRPVRFAINSNDMIVTKFALITCSESKIEATRW